MHEVALPDRLDKEQVLAPRLGRPRSGRDQPAEGRIILRVADVGGDHVLCVAEQRRERGK